MSETDEEDNKVECGTHGSTRPAYVCGHLAWNPVQRWYSNPPAENDPWPDAWCSKCEAAFQAAGGEWNDENESTIGIKLLCGHCYEDFRARSIDALQGEALAAWEELLGRCWGELQDKRDRLAAEFEFGRHARYDWNQETGELVFSNAGGPAVIASIQFVGTLSTLSGTWLWSWANFSLLENVRLEMDKLRVFGEAHGFPRLTVPKWVADEADGWEMAAVAVHVLGALGAYRTPYENGFTYMLITGIRKA